MKPFVHTFFLFLISFTTCQVSSQLIPQQDLVSTLTKFQYICGSDPFRFYSEFPCNMYPVCINGGFKINVGCQADYQCSPYAQNAVCINSCCCTVPRIIGPDIATTTQRFFDNSGRNFFNFAYTNFVFVLLLIMWVI